MYTSRGINEILSGMKCWLRPTCSPCEIIIPGKLAENIPSHNNVLIMLSIHCLCCQSVISICQFSLVATYRTTKTRSGSSTTAKVRSQHSSQARPLPGLFLSTACNAVLKILLTTLPIREIPVELSSLL